MESRQSRQLSRWLMLAGLLGIGTAGFCDGGPTEPVVEHVRASQDTLTLLHKHTAEVSATPLGHLGVSIEGGTMTWTSRSPGIVKVASVASGLRSATLLATGTGVAEVEARAGGQFALIRVTVPDTVFAVQANPTNPALSIGEVITLSTTVHGPATASTDLTWSVANASKVRLTVVDARSVTLLALDSGTTIVKATSVVDTSKHAVIPVSVARPTQLVFAATPNPQMAELPFKPGWRVTVLDSLGKPFPTSQTIMIAATPGTGDGGRVTGTLSKNANDGTVLFDDLVFDKAASGYTLTATANGLPPATSPPFDVAPLPVRLAFIGQPSDVLAGSPIMPPIRVGLFDATGAVVTNPLGYYPVAMSLSRAGGLGGTLVTSPVNGIATFPDLSVAALGTDYLLAAAVGPESPNAVAPVTSQPFKVAPGAVALTVEAHPRTIVGAILSPPLAVALRGSDGAIMTAANNPVTVSITSGSGANGATLAGSKTVFPAGGVATFPDLSIDRPGVGYRLTVSAEVTDNITRHLTSATTDTFRVGGAARRLGFLAQPTSVGAGRFFQVQVGVLDDLGTVVTSATNVVTLSLGSSTDLLGLSTVAAVNGLASFTVAIGGAGSYVMSASATGLTSGTGAPIIVTGVPVASVSVEPSTLSMAPGTTHQLVATARDSTGSQLVARAFTWISANPAVATVSASGAVTAASFGTTTISAASEGRSGSATVVVAPQIAARVTAGKAHTCDLNATGAVGCWGDDTFGQLGSVSPTGYRNVPTPITGSAQFVVLEAGGAHTCGLSADSAAYCWGSNFGGKLGDGTTTDRFAPVAVAGGLSFVSLAAGNTQTCGLTKTGAAYCWGDNPNGQLGDGTVTRRLTPVPVQAGRVFTALAAGGDHTCGLTPEGAAYCWGSNRHGQLGDGTTVDRLTAQPVVGGLTFAALAAGDLHTCGLTAGGAAYCWGFNSSGQLGDGSFQRRESPTAVQGGLVFEEVQAGGHTCARTTAGAAFCWGGGGALGDGTTENRTVPVGVLGGLAFKSLAPADGYTCGMTTAGVVYCWGRAFTGQLGNGSSSGLQLTPVRVLRP